MCFLDSDDYWLPNKLEVLSQAIEANKEADVFYHYEIMLDQNTSKETLLSHHRRLDNMYKDMLENGNQLSASATTIRKSFLNDHQLFFNESHDFDIVEDYDLWLRITSIYPVLFLDEFLIKKYGGHEDQLSRTPEGIEQYRIKSLEKIMSSNLLPESQFQTAKDMLITKLQIFANGLEKRQKIDEFNVIQKKILYWNNMTFLI